MPYRAGLPDLIACVRGRFVALEVKGARGKASPLQLHVLERIRRAGGVAGIVRSIEDVEELLREEGV